jgi:hypothetical protein
MFLLLSGQNLGNHLIRSSLPMLVPFITQDLGCSAAESALLLGSFFPGCKFDLPRLSPADALQCRYHTVVVVRSVSIFRSPL